MQILPSSIYPVHYHGWIISFCRIILKEINMCVLTSVSWLTSVALFWTLSWFCELKVEYRVVNETEMGTGGKDKDGESAQLVGGSKDLESGEEDDSIDKCKPEKKGFGAKCLTCFRGCFGFILFPFVFIITFIACLVWIILLPGLLTIWTDIFGAFKPYY